MNIFDKIPFFRFIKICRNSGGIDLNKTHHLIPWLLKLILFEPFRIIESALFNAKIRRYEIKSDPIFILGYYRSGTTYLQRLFSQNKKLGYQTIFHSALPEISLGFLWLIKPILSVVSRLFRLQNEFHKVPFTWDFPGEEDVAIAGFSYIESPNWGNLFPNSFFHYYREYAWNNIDSVASVNWKRRYHYWIKKLSILNKNKQLVLKSPPNTGRIESLLQIFPNAKFICIHRDPRQLYVSCLRFWDILNKYYSFQKISKENINKMILESFDKTMNRYHDMKEMIPEGHLFEITYESLREFPFNRFKTLYECMGLNDFKQIEKDLGDFISSTRHYPFTSYRLSPKDEDKIKNQWQIHIEYWEYLKKQKL